MLIGTYPMAETFETDVFITLKFFRIQKSNVIHVYDLTARAGSGTAISNRNTPATKRLIFP